MKLVGLFILLFTFNTFALEQKLVNITNDSNTTFVQFFLNLDIEGNVKHLRYVIADDKQVDENQIVTNTEFRNGNIFRQGLFKKYVKMSCPDFIPSVGGTIYMSFPQTIFSSKVIKLQFNLIKTNSGWSLDNDKLIDIKNVRAIVKRALGIPIGVKNIRYSR